MNRIRARLLLALAAGLTVSLLAQDSAPIWAGVFTAAQAERGRAVAQAHCTECHGEDLGGGEAPALVGSTFMVKWETHTVERLFHKIRDTMPTRASTDVSEREKLETVAYILQLNGFPAGTTELADADGALAAVRMIPRGGPAAPRAGALVQAIGCLREAAPSRWVLTESTDPQVTTLDPLSAEDKEPMAGVAPGTQTIELLSVFPRPTSLVQNTVIVKGLLIRTASSQRINVTSLELVHLQCGK
jgi:mono/diheme cytochrome c family protein